ncbi:TetR family transcriptional regulator [Nocardioides convexus]|uniref:TetR family transcriptional regulator n=1 Tax=Nocardioides convexus TaxID=2712224 RepID=UPI002418652C|nr:TetR family transcriptional regulator [Nocardioides convexus]
MPSATVDGSTTEGSSGAVGPTRRRLPTQARSRERVERILDGAAQLVVTEGVDGLTTRSIADTAGLPVASLYQYFADKEAVLLALCERDMAEMDDQVAADLAALGEPDHGLPRGDLDARVREGVPPASGVHADLDARADQRRRLRLRPPPQQADHREPARLRRRRGPRRLPPLQRGRGAGDRRVSPSSLGDRAFQARLRARPARRRVPHRPGRRARHRLPGPGHGGPAVTDALRAGVATAARRLAAAGLLVGTAGNVSARDGDLVAVTGTGVTLGTCTDDDVTVVSRSGEVLAGRLAPTSESRPPPRGLRRRAGRRRRAHPRTLRHRARLRARRVAGAALPTGSRSAARSGSRRTPPSGRPPSPPTSARPSPAGAPRCSPTTARSPSGPGSTRPSRTPCCWNGCARLHHRASALGTPRALTEEQQADVIRAALERGYGTPQEIP